MADQTILITGGTGFAGSHLVEALLNSGTNKDSIHVTSYGNSKSVVHELLSENNIHSLDLTNFDEAVALLKKLQPDYIYHLAAIASVHDSFENPSPVIINNMALQLSLFEALKKIQQKPRVLSIGSAQEYDFISYPPHDPINESHPIGPPNPYGVSKLAQDYLALSYFYSYNIPIIRVRPFNHIGERQTDQFVVAAFAKQIVQAEKGELDTITFGNLEAVRDFTDVKDMVKAYKILMEKGKPGDVYNVGTGKGVTVQTILDELISLAHTDIKAEVDQARLRPLDVPVIIADNRKVKGLGWEPTIPLRDTLSRVLDYWRKTI